MRKSKGEISNSRLENSALSVLVALNGLVRLEMNTSITIYSVLRIVSFETWRERDSFIYQLSKWIRSRSVGLVQCFITSHVQ